MNDGIHSRGRAPLLRLSLGPERILTSLIDEHLDALYISRRRGGIRENPKGYLNFDPSSGKGPVNDGTVLRREHKKNPWIGKGREGWERRQGRRKTARGRTGSYLMSPRGPDACLVRGTRFSCLVLNGFHQQRRVTSLT